MIIEISFCISSKRFIIYEAVCLFYIPSPYTRGHIAHTSYHITWNGMNHSSGHLVPSLWDLHMYYLLRPILFPNLLLFFSDYALRTSPGTFSILHPKVYVLWKMARNQTSISTLVRLLMLYIVDIEDALDSGTTAGCTTLQSD